jgi:DNA replication initiation complex subunit (GINS family)
MNLKIEYEKLFKHWRKEFEKVHLTQFSEESLEKYKQIQEELNNVKRDHDELGTILVEKYINNFNYLLEDLLKLRKIKIVNFSLNLKELEIDKLLEFEKVFYKNIVSSTKGYEKIKAYSDSKWTNKDSLYNVIEERHIVREGNLTEGSRLEEKDVADKLQEKEIDYQVPERNDKDIEYTLLRFKEHCPAIAGVDLLNYGPFKRDDLAYLPQAHAKILILDKIAEEIDISK